MPHYAEQWRIIRFEVTFNEVALTPTAGCMIVTRSRSMQYESYTMCVVFSSGSAAIRRYLVLIPLLAIAPAQAGNPAPVFLWLAQSAHIVTEPLSGSDRGASTSNREASATLHQHWLKQSPGTFWMAETRRLIIKHRRNPLRAARALTHVSVAMHDAHAVGAARGLDALSCLSAAHGAGAMVTTYFFPEELPGRLQALGHAATTALRASERDAARIIAERVARLTADRAMRDGADEVWDPHERPPPGPGVWRGTPPMPSAFPQEPLAGGWRTWVLEDVASILPPAPPAVDSAAVKAAVQEVANVTRSLTPRQKQLADAWHLGQGTATPPGVWNAQLDRMLARIKVTESRRLLMYSALNVAMMDASIAAWHAKYKWWTPRPVTLIQERVDARFQPYLVTPIHPGYVSGHAAVSAAAAHTLKAFFPAQGARLEKLAAEAAASRLYGGIHFRYDNEAGLDLGRRVARAVLGRLKADQR